MKYWRKPLDAERCKPPHGNVHIIINRCKGCGFCITYCPKRVLEFSKDFNRKGYHPPVVVQPDACVNCGLCETLCPEFAIWSTEDKDPGTGIEPRKLRVLRGESDIGFREGVPG